MAALTIRQADIHVPGNMVALDAAIEAAGGIVACKPLGVGPDGAAYVIMDAVTPPPAARASKPKRKPKKRK